MKRRNLLFVVGIICYVVFVVGNIGCPIKYLTGFSCPGCGMSRATLFLLSGDIKKAFEYHPLVLLPIILLLVWIIGYRRKVIPNAFLLFALFLFIAVYLYRILNGDPVVTINYHEGLLFRIIGS